MGNKRKLNAMEEALATANAHNATLQHRLAEIQTHAWTLQMVCAAVLEKLTDAGSLVLTLAERREALENEWGIETTVLPDESKPMIVRIMRGNVAPPGVEAP